MRWNLNLGCFSEFRFFRLALAAERITACVRHYAQVRTATALEVSHAAAEGPNRRSDVVFSRCSASDVGMKMWFRWATFSNVRMSVSHWTFLTHFGSFRLFRWSFSWRFTPMTARCCWLDDVTTHGGHQSPGRFLLLIMSSFCIWCCFRLLSGNEANSLFTLFKKVFWSLTDTNKIKI